MNTQTTLIIREKNGGRRWKVRACKTLVHAWSAINMAKVTGSVGSYADEQTINADGTRSAVTVLADVVEVNSDNTERQPYTARY